jgi:hypothetical protein
MCRLKTKVVRHLVLQGLDLGREKLYDLAALCADHVIMVGVIVMMFVIGPIVAKSDLASEACFREQL